MSRCQRLQSFVRPDPPVPVVAGPYGGSFHFLEYERLTNGTPSEHKLRPHRRMAELGRALPALVATTLAGALRGRLTGNATVWRRPSGEPVALHCPPRQ